jgi:hypothetical protein
VSAQLNAVRGTTRALSTQLELLWLSPYYCHNNELSEQRLMNTCLREDPKNIKSSRITVTLTLLVKLL